MIHDEGPTRPGRDEPTAVRLDRNWAELLQELRVAQTGVQILTAFLLTVPFSAGFRSLTDDQQAVYMAVLVAAMSSTVLLLAPVALHRNLFHRGQRAWLVADRLSRAGLVLLGVAQVGAVWLIGDVVLGAGVGVGVRRLDRHTGSAAVVGAAMVAASSGPVMHGRVGAGNPPCTATGGQMTATPQEPGQPASPTDPDDVPELPDDEPDPDDIDPEGVPT